jgi:rhamnulose-1-phosphate aldolase
MKESDDIDGLDDESDIDSTGLADELAAFANVAALLCDRGWAERNAGNMSIDVTEVLAGDVAATPAERGSPAAQLLAGRSLLVTCGGARMRDVAADPDLTTVLVRVNAAGGYDCSSPVGFCHVDAPTSELAAHLAVHAALRRSRPEHTAVLHTHPAELIAATHCPGLQDAASFNRALWSMQPESVVVLPEGAALLPYLLTGSDALAEATAEAAGATPLVVWPRHGCVATGAGLEDAFDRIDVAAASLRIWLQCRAAGYEPVGLTEEQVAELRKRFTRS